MATELTEFELKVLRISKRCHGHIPNGDKCIHYRAAARRLEKKGMVFHSSQGNRFPLTEAGERAIASGQNDPMETEGA